MKGFCEKCRDIVEYNIKIEERKKTIKGRTIRYNAKVAYCCDCKEEIFVHEVRDYNLNELDKAYRKAENLVMVNDIEEILEKYDIGKRPLSTLLGWGEGTVTRYVDGDTPSKPYSDKLRRIMEDEEYYRVILEDNKDSISDLAYHKSVAAIEKGYISMQRDTDKLESAVKYLLNKTSDITPLALQKLLYFAQGFQKAFSGEYMFNEDCEAWVHGPVYRDIYEKYKGYGYNPIEEKVLCLGDINLAEDEKELLDYILYYFGCYSGKVLENMTHSEKPWRMARSGLKDGENSDRVISKETIGEYFEDVKGKYEMLNFADIKDYSTNLFSKLYQ